MVLLNCITFWRRFKYFDKRGIFNEKGKKSERVWILFQREYWKGSLKRERQKRQGLKVFFKERIQKVAWSSHYSWTFFTIDRSWQSTKVLRKSWKVVIMNKFSKFLRRFSIFFNSGIAFSRNGLNGVEEKRSLDGLNALNDWKVT